MIDYPEKKSSPDGLKALIDHLRFDWNQIIRELKEWQRLKDSIVSSGWSPISSCKNLNKKEVALR